MALGFMSGATTSNQYVHYMTDDKNWIEYYKSQAKAQSLGKEQSPQEITAKTLKSESDTGREQGSQPKINFVSPVASELEQAKDQKERDKGTESYKTLAPPATEKLFVGNQPIKKSRVSEPVVQIPLNKKQKPQRNKKDIIRKGKNNSKLSSPVIKNNSLLNKKKLPVKKKRVLKKDCFGVY